MIIWCLNHPSEKYAQVKLDHFPKDRGENQKIIKTITYTPENERLEPKNHPIEKAHHLPNLHYCVPY